MATLLPIQSPRASHEPQRQLLDNAVAEAFFGSLKKELVKKQIYKSRDLATAAIADYIETFYHRSRRHSHLGVVSPEQCEAAHKRRKHGVH